MDHAVALGLGHVIGEDGRPCLARRRTAQLLGEAMAVEDVVAENQRNGIAGNEFLADQERLGQALRRRLDRVRDVDAPVAAVAQQSHEGLLVLRRGDDEHFANTREHQNAQRVVDHRLVVDRHQLLADRMGQRMQARAGAAGEDDAFVDCLVHGAIIRIVPVAVREPSLQLRYSPVGAGLGSRSMSASNHSRFENRSYGTTDL